MYFALQRGYFARKLSNGVARCGTVKLGLVARGAELLNVMTQPGGSSAEAPTPAHRMIEASRSRFIGQPELLRWSTRVGSVKDRKTRC